MMGKTVDRNGFIQICIVVSDIDLAAEKWAQVLGIEKNRRSVRRNSKAEKTIPTGGNRFPAKRCSL